MLDWKMLALIAPLFIATYQALSKFLPKNTSIYLISAYSSFIGMIFMLGLHLLLSKNKGLILNPKTISLVLGIGLLISLANFSFIKAFTLGAPQSIFSLISYVALIIYGILFGVLLFHEKLSMPQIFGAILSIVGILIIVYYKK